MSRSPIGLLAGLLLLASGSLAPLCAAWAEFPACCAACEPAVDEGGPTLPGDCCSVDERPTADGRTGSPSVGRPSTWAKNSAEATADSTGTGEGHGFVGSRLETPDPPVYLATHNYRI